MRICSGYFASLVTGFLFLSQPVAGLCQGGAKSAAPDAQQSAPASQESDGPVTNSTSDNKQWAWNILTDSLNDKKHSDVRIQALAALGLMGNDPRSLKLILDTMDDPDIDLRTAAVLAAGETKAPAATTDLRRMLDDKEPQVAFAAATTLWKMNDRSGEDILVAVVNGERKAGSTLVGGTMHTVNRDLHHPTDLARVGALQGASMLLGPFGFGITALEYMRKNGADTARVAAVEQVSQNHTAPIRTTLIAALKDKDVAVRTAAAKALAGYHEPDVAPALADEFPDPKTPVRLTAAAAYLMSTGVVVTPPELTTKPTAKTAKKTAHK